MFIQGTLVCCIDVLISTNVVVVAPFFSAKVLYHVSSQDCLPSSETTCYASMPPHDITTYNMFPMAVKSFVLLLFPDSTWKRHRPA